MTAETGAAKKTAAKKTAPSTPVEKAGDHATLAEALVAFMLEKPRVAKNQEARIPGKNGGPGYSYKYADLADVDDAATPVLARHGLAFVAIPARTENGSYELVGTLIHTSGEKLEGPLPLQGRTAQELGSSLTYMRRYLLGAMTGIVTDEDDDGSRAQQAQGNAEPAGPPERQPQMSRAPHVEEVAELIQGLSAAERDNVGPWWDNAARDGHLPPRTNLGALTPAQAAWVQETVAHMRQVAEEAAGRDAELAAAANQPVTEDPR